jgi:hypothetical protein
VIIGDGVGVMSGVAGRSMSAVVVSRYEASREESQLVDSSENVEAGDGSTVGSVSSWWGSWADAVADSVCERRSLSDSKVGQLRRVRARAFGPAVPAESRARVIDLKGQNLLVCLPSRATGGS